MSSNIYCWHHLTPDDESNLSVDLIDKADFKRVFEQTCYIELMAKLELGPEMRNRWQEIMEQETKVMVLGVAALLLFVQQNWTGPFGHVEIMNVDDLHKNIIFKELVLDGESIPVVIHNIELLMLASVIFSVCQKHFSSSKVAKLWHLRCMFIHQQILEEVSPQLFNEMEVIIDSLKSASNIDDEKPTYCLEFARIYLYYGYVQKAKLELDSALGLYKMETSLIGALGKRTKFQQANLPQLTFKVSLLEKNDKECDVECNVKFPQDLKLNDEVRLEKIKFVDESEAENPNLNGLQKAVVLGLLNLTLKSQPKDGLVDEVVFPMLSCILENPKVWAIHFTALLMRSKLECQNKRTVDRSMMQSQTLVECLEAGEPAMRDRLQCLFLSYLPPRHQVQAVLADVMLSLGAVKSALDIFLALQDWEKVVICYNMLQLRHKAKEVIEQELAKEPSPKLWCMLGDATDDVSCYEKAWELSGHRSARAQRHWALYLYDRKLYQECIEHFEKALEINSLQSNLWFRLGFAALHQEQWETSARAYRRYCAIDSESFKAWNNLARCYCELKQPRRAWRALQEALKLDYSNWRVWDNYMIVSAELAELEEVVRSYHQVLDLKEKHLDVAVLRSLVVGLCDAAGGGSEGEREGSAKTRSKVLTLFGRLTSQIPNDPDLWNLYSEVPMADTAQSRVKRQQLLLKAHRAGVNKPGWDKTEESCVAVVRVLNRLIDVSLELQEKAALTSCKMAVVGAVALIKKQQPGTELCDGLDERLQRLTAALETAQ